MTLSAGTKLGPYEILSPIGAGGMGEVWKARDTRLGRIVAIKKVKEQHSERFKQEARSIAALNHPNICQIHDIGDDYFVLEYVEGKPLTSPLPEKEAVRLAIQIASALEEAHRNGIIHRDLKPSNIMVTDKGSVKLLDFGLAKLYEQSASISTSPTADFPATQAGAVLGTVAYMSPEQAQGQPADARSDIFSFGLVLYEMLSGRRAFSGDTPHAMTAALLRDDPLALQASPSLERIVHRCLAKQPSARFQIISEVRTALEQLSREMESKNSSEPQPSIAVLPFVNMSGDKEQEYFSDGLAEEIINALTQIPGLKVIARTSSFSFRGKEQDIRKIAEALSVTNILEGSVRKAENRIRVTAQLIDAADGSHLWSDRYDREIGDVFAIQDEISYAIAQRMRLRLSGDRPPVKRYTQNLEAYNLYLKGRYHFIKFTAESLAKSKEFYEQAITMDPDYALPWVGLAGVYEIMGGSGFMSPKSAYAQGYQTARRALELDETLPEAHAMIGVLRVGEYDWQGAEREFRRAMEIDPMSEEVLTTYSVYFLLPLQRYNEAIDLTRKALEINPLSPLTHTCLGIVYAMAGQWDRAVDQNRHALLLDPNYWVAYVRLGWTYVFMGELEQAIQAFEAGTQLRGRVSYVGASLGYAYAQTGRLSEAQGLLKEMEEQGSKTYVRPGDIGRIYLGLGETDKAFDWLEKAIDEHDSLTAIYLTGPTYNPLRSHPRYHALLRKMNLDK